MNIKIEKGIPLTRPSKNILFSGKLRELEVNESFRFPSNDYGTMRFSIASIQRKYKRKFTCRNLQTGEFRVWRIK